MNRVAIYLEGDVSLRQGMSSFLGGLRDAAWQRGAHWKVVACGSRDNARNAFVNANETEPENFNVLLVDSEAPVTRPLLIHLGWKLSRVKEEPIHLMIQVMETWLIADTVALAGYYGEYHKTRHAPALLERIDPDKVRRRCPSCDRLFNTLSTKINEA